MLIKLQNATDESVGCTKPYSVIGCIYLTKTQGWKIIILNKKSMFLFKSYFYLKQIFFIYVTFYLSMTS